MAPPKEDVLSTVFKASNRAGQGQGNYSLDGQTLAFLLALDGQTTLGEVIRKLKIDLNTAKELLNRLAKLKLVLRASPQDSIVDPSFVAFLKTQLMKAAGPIADVLLDDILIDLKLDKSRIPRSQAPTIVQMLAREIADETARASFVKLMLSKL